MSVTVDMDHSHEIHPGKYQNYTRMHRDRSKLSQASIGADCILIAKTSYGWTSLHPQQEQGRQTMQGRHGKAEHAYRLADIILKMLAGFWQEHTHKRTCSVHHDMLSFFITAHWYFLRETLV